jgi:hypothetical protein
VAGAAIVPVLRAFRPCGAIYRAARSSDARAVPRVFAPRLDACLRVVLGADAGCRGCGIESLPARGGYRLTSELA